MPETRPPLDIDRASFDDIAAMLEAGTAPPVDKWDPPSCGDSDMRIARDGRWYHQGGLITRPAMVRLFFSVLRREPDDGYVLVTPVEKLAIAVDHLPFLATRMRREGDGRDRRLAFTLNTDEIVIAGADHPIRIVETQAGPSPRLLVRGRLEAEIARPLYYAPAEITLEDGRDPPAIWSDGERFPLS